MTPGRLLLGIRDDRPLTYREHVDVHGPSPRGGAALIDAVAAAGLRGRGGASFPTAIKLRAVAGRRRPIVVVNAAEGEPLSAKDRTLIRLAPHLVLDGALAAAAAVGARHVVVAVRDDGSGAVEAARAAVAERRGARDLVVAAVPATYLAGEETALIRHLGGGPLAPTVVPPRPAERGLRGRPTLVQNAETLAHVALIARHGARWYREAGTDADPGTTLVTVSGAVARPGVHEIALGERLDAVLARAGGPRDQLRAVLVGGYHGTFLTEEQLTAATLDDGRLRAHGATLAAGVIVALGASACPVTEAASVIGWLAAQSAGQCGPCRNGLPAIADQLARVRAGRADPDALALLRRWARQLPGRGACRLPDGAVRFLDSVLRAFEPELADHERHGPCASCNRPGVIPVVPYAPRNVAA